MTRTQVRYKGDNCKFEVAVTVLWVRLPIFRTLYRAAMSRDSAANENGLIPRLTAHELPLTVPSEPEGPQEREDAWEDRTRRSQEDGVEGWEWRAGSGGSKEATGLRRSRAAEDR